MSGLEVWGVWCGGWSVVVVFVGRAPFDERRALGERGWGSEGAGTGNGEGPRAGQQ